MNMSASHADFFRFSFTIIAFIYRLHMFNISVLDTLLSCGTTHDGYRNNTTTLEFMWNKPIDVKQFDAGSQGDIKIGFLILCICM